MKNMSKLLALVLALSMLLAMATAVSAATGGTIKVTGTAGTTYTVIKMYSAQRIVNEPNNKQYIYTVAPGWEGFTAGGLVTVNGTNVLIPNEIANGAAFAAQAAEYASANGITSSLTVTAAEDGATVAVPDDGYYLLMASGGGISGVVHVVGGEEAEVKEKTSAATNYPSLIKKVQEDSNSNFGDANTADIGQDITFQITVNVGANAKDYVIHDIMDAGLSFVGITSITLGGNTVDAANYTVTTPVTDCCSFEIAFLDNLLNASNITSGTPLIVTYTARLNDTAAANTEYKNSAWLTHAAGDTPMDTTTTSTFAFQITKTSSATGDPLEGVGFQFVNKDDETIQMFKQSDGVYVVCRDTSCTAHTHVNEVFTNAAGQITITGLDADTYTIPETTVLPGYVAPATDTTATINDTAAAIVTLALTNALGESLPETGGMGTTLFYIFGSVMVLGAVVLLVTKKRMTAAE